MTTRLPEMYDITGLNSMSEPVGYLGVGISRDAGFAHVVYVTEERYPTPSSIAEYIPRVDITIYASEDAFKSRQGVSLARIEEDVPAIVWESLGMSLVRWRQYPMERDLLTWYGGDAFLAWLRTLIDRAFAEASESIRST